MSVLIERDKVSAVSLDLCDIRDLTLPAQVKTQVKCLFLSNNYLHHLHGLPSFTQLQILSLANNALRYLEELQPLSALRHLKRASLTGNPVAKLPYYRETIASLCVNIESLDGQKIDEVARAELRLRQKHAQLFFCRAANNSTRNCVLQHVICKVQYHEELHRVFGKLRFLHSEFVGNFAYRKTGQDLVDILRVLRHSDVFECVASDGDAFFSKQVQNTLYQVRAEWEQSKKGNSSGTSSVDRDADMLQKLLAQQEHRWMAMMQRFSLFCERDRQLRSIGVHSNPPLHDDGGQKVERDLVMEMQKLFLPKPLQVKAKISPSPRGRPSTTRTATVPNLAYLVQQQEEEEEEDEMDQHEKENIATRTAWKLSSKDDDAQRTERLQAIYETAHSRSVEEQRSKQLHNMLEKKKGKTSKNVHFAQVFTGDSDEDANVLERLQPTRLIEPAGTKRDEEDDNVIHPANPYFEELPSIVAEGEGGEEEDVSSPEATQQLLLDGGQAVLDAAEELLLDGERFQLRFTEAQKQLNSALQNMSHIMLENNNTSNNGNNNAPGGEQIMSTEQIEKILASVRPLHDGEMATMTMAQCKQQIQQWSKQLILLQRSEHAAFRLFHALHSETQRGEAVLQTLLREAVPNVQRVLALRRQIAALTAGQRQEQVHAATVLQQAEQHLSDARNDLEAQRLCTATLREAAESLQAEKCTEAALWRSLEMHRANLVATAKGALGDILQLQKTVISSRLLNCEFPQKIVVYRRSLLRTCYTTWKSKVAIGVLRRRRLWVRLQRVFVAWRKVARVSKLGEFLSARRHAICKKRLFWEWRAAVSRRMQQDRVISSLTSSQKRLQRAFAAFRLQIRLSVEARLVQEQQQFATNLFSIVRILRAWKELTKHGKAKMIALEKEGRLVCLRFVWIRCFLENNVLKRRHCDLEVRENQVLALNHRLLLRHSLHRWSQQWNRIQTMSVSRRLRCCLSRWKIRCLRKLTKQKSTLLLGYAEAVANVLAFRRILWRWFAFRQCLHAKKGSLRLAHFHYLRKLARSFLRRKTRTVQDARTGGDADFFLEHALFRKKLVCRYRASHVVASARLCCVRRAWNLWTNCLTGNVAERPRLAEGEVQCVHDEVELEHSLLVADVDLELNRLKLLELVFAEWKQACALGHRVAQLASRRRHFQQERHFSNWYSACLRVWRRQLRHDRDTQREDSLLAEQVRKQDMERAVLAWRNEKVRKERLAEALRVEFAQCLDVQEHDANEFHVRQSELELSARLLEQQKYNLESSLQSLKEDISLRHLHLEDLRDAHDHVESEEFALSHVCNPPSRQLCYEEQKEVREAKSKLEELHAQKVRLHGLILEEKQALESVYAALADSVLSLETRYSERFMLSQSLLYFQESLQQICQQICQEVSVHEQEITLLEAEKARCLDCLHHLHEQEKAGQRLLELIRMRQKQNMQQLALGEKLEHDRVAVNALITPLLLPPMSHTYTSLVDTNKLEVVFKPSTGDSQAVNGEEMQLNQRIQELTSRLKHRIQEQQEQIARS